MITDKDEHLEEVIKYCQQKFGWVNTSSLTLYQIEMINEVIKAVKNIAVLDGVMPIIGTRVKMHLTHNDRIISGTVIKKPKDGKAMIRWDHDDDITTELINNLNWA